MPFSLYQLSVPLFTRGLNNLSGVLRKGEAHAEAKKLDQAALLAFRLYPDMFNFTRQIQVAADAAKGCVARLAGMEPPVYEDNERTFAELLARVDKTIAYISGFKAAQIDDSEKHDSEKRPIVLKLRAGEMTFTAEDFLLGFAQPNFYFHVTTAYDILRHNGVELGKRDFLGWK